jgi:hypothetical protein
MYHILNCMFISRNAQRFSKKVSIIICQFLFPEPEPHPYHLKDDRIRFQSSGADKGLRCSTKVNFVCKRLFVLDGDTLISEKIEY